MTICTAFFFLTGLRLRWSPAIIFTLVSHNLFSLSFLFFIFLFFFYPLYILLIPSGRDPFFMPPEIRVSAKLWSLMSLRLGSDTLDVHWLNAPGLNSPLSPNSKRQPCFTCCIIAHRLKFCCFCFEFTSFTGSSLLFRAAVFFFFLLFFYTPLFISSKPLCLQAARLFVP